MLGLVHEIDVIGDVDPVESDVREQLADSDLFKIAVLFLQETAVGSDCVYHSCHFKYFLNYNKETVQQIRSPPNHK